MSIELFLSILFGGLNVAQWIGQLRAAMKHDARQEHILGIKRSLQQFNGMCNDAANKGDASKPDAMARFISDAAHLAKTIEHQTDILLGTVRLIEEQPAPWLKRALRWIFPATRIK